MQNTPSAPVRIRRRLRPSALSVAYATARQPQSLKNSLTIADFRAAAEDWLLDGEARLSRKTVTDRRNLIGKLTWWLETNGCTVVGRSEMQRFYAYMPTAHLQPGGRWGTADQPAADSRATRAMRPRSCANYFRWLRTFWLYLVECGTLDESPQATLKPARHRDDQITPFSLEQVAALLDVAANRSYYPRRNVALLLLFFDTGARVSEICGLRVRDVNTQERSILVLGKGNTHRTLYLQPRTLKAIQDYMRGDHLTDDDPLFIGENGNALTPNGITQLFRRLARPAKITGVRCSPHTSRHTFAIEFLRAGGDPITLQVMMGHKDMAMTRRYLSIAGADMKRAHAKYSLVAGLKTPKGRKR